MTTPLLWNQDSPHRALYDELWRKLVPSSGPALAPHGELLRSVARIYYDRYNNGFGNGPFDDEFEVIKSHRSELSALMPGDDFRNFIQAFEFKNRGESVLHAGEWSGDAPMESLMTAAILYAGKVDKTYQGPRSIPELFDRIESNDIDTRTAAKRAASDMINNHDTPPELLKAIALAAITRLEEKSPENTPHMISRSTARAPGPR